MNPIILSLLFLTLTLTSPCSQAKPPYADTDAREQSLSQVVSKIKKRTGGRILSADTTTEKGQKSHQVKVLLPNGKIRRVRLDAE